MKVRAILNPCAGVAAHRTREAVEQGRPCRQASKRCILSALGVPWDLRDEYFPKPRPARRVPFSRPLWCMRLQYVDDAMPTLTLVTCTRNPDPAALRRVVTAVAGLTVPEGWTREYLLVDSASAPPLSDRVGAAGIGPAGDWMRVLRADQPGLSVARRLALREAKGELLAWFDDDNVPDAEYLVHAVATAAAHPEVSVWGAGTITVEFTGRVAGWVEREMRPFFQERAHPHDEFGAATAAHRAGWETQRVIMEK